MKEEMLAEVASPAINTRITIKTEEQTVQPAVQSGERVNGRNEKPFRCLVLFAFCRAPYQPTSFRLLHQLPSMRQETTMTVVVAYDSTTTFRSSPKHPMPMTVKRVY
jgi:hypothetical protein